ncbi:hypothetical protein HNQ55_000770 [Thalassotalea piscium]|uniref:Uncharacterized protein n=1 Tax=Thalassotalea piscium TaxID=1230533 RepID=A0A7X0NF29_9GAMM|nr:hypothetical protein [Thalassotalea piscium]
MQRHAKKWVLQGASIGKFQDPPHYYGSRKTSKYKRLS